MNLAPIPAIHESQSMNLAPIPAIKVVPSRMREAALQGFSTATDLADYLVRSGIPFRDAHEIVGQAVAHCIKSDCDLAGLPLETLQGFHPAIAEDVFEVLTLEGSIAARNHIGGTAPAQVREAIGVARAALASR